MDRGAWQATVYGVTGVKHDLATKLPATYLHTHTYIQILSFPGGSDGRESTCNVGNLGLSPGLGWSPGGRHDNPLQYSFLERCHGQWRIPMRSQRIRHNWVIRHTNIGKSQETRQNVNPDPFPPSWWHCHCVISLCCTHLMYEMAPFITPLFWVLRV